MFFIDDYQTVRPGEVGSSTLFREAAVKHGASFQEVDLQTQFRCAGSDEYIDWIDQLLEIRRTGRNRLGAIEAFDFRIVDDPFSLEQLVRARAEEGATARLTAGFCWRWSDPTTTANSSMTLSSVTFGSLGMQRPMRRACATASQKGSTGRRTRAASTRSGAIHNAQGFEFDYCGVIVGRDMVRRDNKWVGQRTVLR